VLNIVDDVTRECLAAIPDTSILRRRVARELTTLIERRGKLAMISRTRPRMPPLPGRKIIRSSGTTSRREADAKRLYRELQRQMRDELVNQSLFLVRQMPEAPLPNGLSSQYTSLDPCL